jgi:hypothetical protein
VYNKLKSSNELKDVNAEENRTLYWIHIMRQMQMLNEDETKYYDKRLLCMALKSFVLNNVKETVINYTTPTYPNTVPFIMSDNPNTCVVYELDGELVDMRTRKPYLKYREFTSQDEIDSMYEKNLGTACEGGWLIRPTYLTGGKIVSWISMAPTKSQALRDQLELLGYPKLQIDAHIHTLNNNNCLLTAPFGDEKTANELLKQVQSKCSNVQSLVDNHTLTVTYKQVMMKLASQDEKVGDILWGITKFPETPNPQNVTELDYLMTFKNTENLNVVLPPTPLFDKLRETYMSYIAKTKEPLQLLGESNMFEYVKEQNKKEQLTCPISLEEFKDPAITVPCGHTFEYGNISGFVGKPCPLCNTVVEKVIKNYIVKDLVST